MRIHTIPRGGMVTSQLMLHAHGSTVALGSQPGLPITKQGDGTGDF